MDIEIDGFRWGQKLLNLLEKKDPSINSSEVYITVDNILNIKIEENSIKNSRIKLKKGISTRCIDNRGACGFAFTNSFQQNDIENIATEAIKLMKNGTKDPDFKKLPSKYQKYPKIKDLYDDDIANIQVEDTSRFASELIKVGEENDLAISQSGNFVSQSSEIYILNSNGIQVSEKRAYASVSSNMIVRDETTKETAFGYESKVVRTLEDLNARKVALSALEDGKRNLNRKKIENMKVPVILTPRGTINLILEPLSTAINAETFQYKRSFLIGRRGDRIASDLINIEDNGLIDGAVGSRTFDDEGVPCKNKKIIENGKFIEEALLHNSYTAGKEGIESTGNATRSSYSSLPSIDSTNFILKPGKSSKDEMISGIKKGILFDYTGDSPNISTGDFSGLILHGNLIKNGNISHPLNETMFGINLIELFRRISEISEEYETYGNYKAPYVKVDNINIIGSK
ncbi:MAG: TldD/PmbA family protein [Promethearchaeota archaeon]|nr:MAG: TldD/PmbA family protein [Candidatus Lokiarchaeota archaeon]